VWVDANNDGITDPGELFSLSQMGIASISLAAAEGDGTIDGQTVIANGGFTYESGQTGQFSAVELTETSNRLVIAADGSDAVIGTSGDDMLVRGELAGLMSGGNGDDWLIGSTGDDALFGDTGADRLMGGGGSDQLWGGSGADVFDYRDASDSIEATKDRINDFSRAEGDKIDISSFAGLLWAGELASSGDLGANQLGYVVNADGSLTVFADSDGNGVYNADADLTFDVAGTPDLLSSDFIFAP
jgi:Ca2+-binding RTX toxin-like protein